MPAFAVQARAGTTPARPKLAAGRSRSLVCRAFAQQNGSSSPSWQSRVAAVALSAVVAASQFPLPSLAVPQTSKCATESCDGIDLSNRDLRKELYTKGSLRGAKFMNSELREVSLFGANLEEADLSGANLELANLGQANLEGANLTQAVLAGAIVSSARFDDKTIIDGADFTDVIIRKDINDKLCKIAKGTNQRTGVDTRESLNCY